MNALEIVKFKLEKMKEVMPECHELWLSVNYWSWVIEKTKNTGDVTMAMAMITSITVDMSLVFGDVPEDGVGKQIVDAWMMVPETIKRDPRTN